MKIHYVSHAAFEGLGAINDWALEKGHALSGTRSYAGEALPDPSAFDVLIVMGGPQSACEYENYDYLQNEVKLIQAANQAGKYILGICLGGQLTSIALGADAERSPHKEMGCYPIELTPEGQSDRIFRHFPSPFYSFHWHYDMMGLPPGAVVLAQTPGCPRQAVRFSDRVYGLQFHLELTEERTKVLIDKCKSDLAPSRYTQTPGVILASDFASINKLIKLFLDKFLEAV